MILAADASISGSSAAWFTLVGTLGGVLVTSVMALVTAILNRRWQKQGAEQATVHERVKEIYQGRRKTYARFFEAEGAVLVACREIRRRPGEEVPEELRPAIDGLSFVYYEIALIASPQVNWPPRSGSTSCTE
jgi:hypothetical protein